MTASITGLDTVDQLVREGDLIGAVDQLAALNRDHPHPELEIRLVDLRALAAATSPPGAGRSPWPPDTVDPFPDLGPEIPEIARAGLTPDVLSGALAHHGALIVRGVFDAEQVAWCVDAIEQVHERRGTSGDPEPTGDPGDERWFRPLSIRRNAMDAHLRRAGHEQGGTFLADCPAGAAFILDHLDRAGVTPAISAHLGERPFFSLQKSTLRRTLPDYRLVSWHQDGAFLGAGVRTVNAWMAFTHCGGDLPTPALEIVPRSLDGILPAEGKMVPHSVTKALVAELAAETPTVIPRFAPGDAILFDERLLHRTYLTEEMTEVRYAVECWFFAPSQGATDDYTQLLV